MILAVASGKGGTGKTTLALSIAGLLGRGTLLLDCDVEEPNTFLFTPQKPVKTLTVSVPVPEVDTSRCDSCGKCAEICQYGAVLSLPRGVMVFPELCHGCGGCVRICPRGAIREVAWRIGVIEEMEHRGLRMIQGRLDVGMTMAPPLVRAVRRLGDREGTVIIDAPPGTSCSAAAAVRGADYVILVAEPTLFGLHDLRLAVGLVRHLRIPFGVVINRSDAGDARVRRFCNDQEIPVLLEIPEDRRIAEAYSRGQMPAEADPQFAVRIAGLLPLIPGLQSPCSHMDEIARVEVGRPPEAGSPPGADTQGLEREGGGR